MNEPQTRSADFLIENDIPWEELGNGISRQVMGYDDRLMLVKVKFEKGSVGSEHRHFHSQSTFVGCGVFEATIRGEKKVLRQGDGFYVEPDALHGVLCLEEGILIDCFSPVRLDFLKI